MKARMAELWIPEGALVITPDGYHVKIVKAGDVPPAAMDRTGDCYEVRPAGSLAPFRWLIGAITIGAVSLVLFEDGVGGKVQATAPLEVIV